MKRKQLNWYVDVTAFVCFVFLLTTGLIIKYILPPGSGSIHGEGRGDRPIDLLWGMTRHQWGEIHFWISVIFMGILVLHLFLHWKWIVCLLKGKPKEESGIKVWLGIIGLVTLLIVAIAPFFSTKERFLRSQLTDQKVHSSENIKNKSIKSSMTKRKVVDITDVPVTDQKVHSPGNSKNKSIKGSMTLREVADITNVPVAHLLKELKLPQNTSIDERLGRLKRVYFFEIEDVRHVVKNYKKSSKQ